MTTINIEEGKTTTLRICRRCRYDPRVISISDSNNSAPMNLKSSLNGSSPCSICGSEKRETPYFIEVEVLRLQTHDKQQKVNGIILRAEGFQGEGDPVKDE